MLCCALEISDSPNWEKSTGNVHHYAEFLLENGKTCLRCDIALVIQKCWAQKSEQLMPDSLEHLGGDRGQNQNFLKILPEEYLQDSLVLLVFFLIGWLCLAEV